MGFGNHSWFISICVRGVYDESVVRYLTCVALLHVAETSRVKLLVIILKILMIYLDGFIISIREDQYISDVIRY
jgi:hypothetical protein